MRSFYSFDHAYKNIVSGLINECDYECRPRGNLVKENIAYTFCLQNPFARLCTSEARGANYGFATGEFLWYARGAYDLASISYYNTRMPSFSDDGECVHSAYGKRIGIAEQVGQWRDCVKELSSDRDSRRVVMTVYSQDDLRRAVTVGTKDVPCTLSLQFMIRDGELNLHVHMRSNDVIWGLPYDLFSFTLMQEMMLLDVIDTTGDTTLRLGKYYHTAGSLHLYERHFDMARNIVAEYDEVGIHHWKCAEMGKLLSLGEIKDLIWKEELLRTRKIEVIHDVPTFSSSAVKWMMMRLNEHKAKRDAERLRKAI